MGQPISCVVDTNIWLDNYVPDRPGSRVARAFFEVALAHGITMLYAVTTAKDVFYLVAAAGKRRTLAREGSISESQAIAAKEYAWGVLDNMAAIATAVGADEADRWLATKYKTLHNDFEDNLVTAAAQRAHADYLVTSDERLLRHAPVAALSPEDMIKLLRAE